MSARLFVGANLALALVLELSAFAALGYGAFHLADSAEPGVALAVAAVLGSAVLWGLFAAPRARHRSLPGVLGVKVVVFAAGTAGLVFDGHLLLGVVMGAAVALNALALHGTDHSYVANPGRPVTDVP